MRPINDIDKKYSFFNPKAGFTFLLNEKSHIYTSVAVGNREPNGDDLTKNITVPKREQLVDYELGYKLKNNKYFASVNLYYMHYNSQLVLTGALDDVGNAIRQNVPKSYRAGIELQASYQISKQFRFDANATFSQNKIEIFDYLVYDTQYDPNTFDVISYAPVTTQFKNTDIAFSPNTIVANTLTFAPTENLSLGFISKYVGQQYLDNTQTASKSMDAYFINNFNASYTWKPKWIGAIKWHLLVNNIFDKKYVSNGYTYSYYYRPQGSSDSPITENFYYPQAGINFLTGLTLSF